MAAQGILGDPRRAILLTIVANEESYLQALTVTVAVFFTPLLQLANSSATFPLRPKATRALFSNLEQLVSVHTRLAAQLTDKVCRPILDGSPAGTVVDDAVSALSHLLVQFAPLLKLYPIYALSFKSNVETTLVKLQTYDTAPHGPQ